MSTIGGLSGGMRLPDEPFESDGPSAAASAGAAAASAASTGGVGGFFSRIFSRLFGRGEALRGRDGDVKLSAGAKEIVERGKSAPIGSREQLVAAYRASLGELDKHFGARRQGGEKGAIDAEARRADFELTLGFATHGRALGLDEPALERLVDELLGAKQGLTGLKVSASDYKNDFDRDGLSARAELLHGTSDYAIDTDLDGLTDLQEVRANLDPTRPRTETGIESNGWSIEGLVWYPYFDDKPVLAFSKFDDVFGASTSREFEPFFETYAAGARGAKGTWIPNSGTGTPGHVRESDFARTAGVNPVDEPTIGHAAVRLLRQSGAPQDARFALRDAAGKPIEPQQGDRLRPTYLEGGALQLAESRSVEGKARFFVPGTDREVRAAVAYRLVDASGKARGGADARVETRNDLLGLRPNLKFDFLDRAGRAVDYSPAAGDQVVATFQDAGRSVALVPEKGADGAVTGYEKRTYDAEGKRIESREALTADAGRALLDDRGTGAIYRVMAGRSGELRGDGDVSQHFDMYWWGKCHNTAKIDQSNMPQPERPVQVARGVEPGETLVTRWTEGGRENLLRPERDAEGAVTGFVHLVGGAEVGRLGVEEAAQRIEGKSARAAILGAGGAVRDAEVVTVSPEEVQTLVAHMGAGATAYKGSVGSRFYAVPDRLELAGGRSLDDVRILDATTASGKKVEVQRLEGGEWKDLQRGLFRGADLKNSRKSQGTRQVAWSESSMRSINAARADKIESVTVQHPDGRKESIPAKDIQRVGRENAYDLSPKDIWESARMIADGKSFTLEKATGPQVWNYAVKDMATERIDRSRVPAAALAADDLPGAQAGTSDKEGRIYFKTEIAYLENGKSHAQDYYYWVKMDKEGKVTDFNYLVDPTSTEKTFAAAPDFFWQTHVKDPVDERWSGESEVRGASMSDIQGLYNASVGNMDHLAVLGVFAADDLAEGRPRRP